MEDDKLIQYKNPKKMVDLTKIDQIQEYVIIKEKEKYVIQFAIIKDELLIKVISEKFKDIFCYEGTFSKLDFQNKSEVFNMYHSLKDIVSVLKKLKSEIEENDNYLIIKFNIYMPDGQNNLFDLSLKKIFADSNNLINYLFEEIKTNKNNIKNLEENLKKEKSKRVMIESEIKNLKEIILKQKEEIRELKEENKKILKMKNKIKKIPKQDTGFGESYFIRTPEDFKSFKFIFNYLKENDKSFNFSKIILLYKASRDGDKTKICHSLCDHKTNILIVIQSDIGYIFGGYSKIGFITKEKNYWEYKEDNNSFLFSLNLQRIYPVIKGRKVICYIGENCGLCFAGSLAFYDNFMNISDNDIDECIKDNFNGFEKKYEMNNGQKTFRCMELEVFKLF